LPKVTIERAASFSPHSAFEDSGGAGVERLRPQNHGISGQIATEVDNAADLILGIDFGTSTTKAVIRDQTAGRAYAVRFSTGEAGHLLASRVYRSNGGYSLDGGGNAIRDLKLRLLDAGVASPVAEFNDACAFLSLVIRHCRGWFFDSFRPRYARHQLAWQVNLGLPARSYEDAGKVRLFQRLAWAAANCASSPETSVTIESVDRWRRSSHSAYGAGAGAGDDGRQFEPEDVDVVPEIAAQVAGFVESARWDWRNRPMMMVVDIGAGTVDSALFSVGRDSSNRLRFAFFADEVLPNGVMNLHRERIGWLRRLLAENGIEDAAVENYLKRISVPTDRLLPIPEHERDYLPGFRVNIPDGALGLDEDFFRHRYCSQVFACIRQTRLRKGVGDRQLQALPFILAGGGARMGLYARIARTIDESAINVNTDRQQLRRPADMVAEGLRDENADRLSVAYGLSRRGPDGGPLGKYVRSVDIPDVLPRKKLEMESRFIDKSMI
jgi:hypothetical protein